MKHSSFNFDLNLQIYFLQISLWCDLGLGWWTMTSFRRLTCYQSNISHYILGRKACSRQVGLSAQEWQCIPKTLYSNNNTSLEMGCHLQYSMFLTVLHFIEVSMPTFSEFKSYLTHVNNMVWTSFICIRLGMNKPFLTRIKLKWNCRSNSTIMWWV